MSAIPERCTCRMSAGARVAICLVACSGGSLKTTSRSLLLFLPSPVTATPAVNIVGVRLYCKCFLRSVPVGAMSEGRSSAQALHRNFSFRKMVAFSECIAKASSALPGKKKPLWRGSSRTRLARTPHGDSSGLHVHRSTYRESVSTLTSWRVNLLRLSSFCLQDLRSGSACPAQFKLARP